MQFNRSLTKYVFLCLLFTASFHCQGQSFPTQLGNFLFYNNTSITTKTGAKSITPINVGGNIDSLGRYMNWLYTLIGGATGYQGTLNAGNTASDVAGGTNSFGLIESSTSRNLVANPNNLQLRSGGTNYIDIGSGAGSAQPYIAYYDKASGNYSKLSATTFTSIWSVNLPNEGGILVTHTTKDPLTVLLGTNSGVYSQNSLIYSTSGVVQFAITSGTGAQISIKDALSAFYGQLSSGVLTGTHGILFPNEGTGSGLSSTIVTHTTKDSVKVVGATYKSTVKDFEIYSQTLGGLDIFKLTNSAGIAQLYMGDGSGANYGIFQNPSLTASRTYTSPDRSGDIALNGAATAPTVASTGAALGTAPTVTLSGTSNDVCGTITAVCGTTPATGGILFSLLWGQAYTGKTPVVQFVPANSNAAGLPLFGSGSSTSATASIQTGAAALTAGNTYIFTYSVKY